MSNVEHIIYNILATKQVYIICINKNIKYLLIGDEALGVLKSSHTLFCKFNCLFSISPVSLYTIRVSLFDLAVEFYNYNSNYKYVLIQVILTLHIIC